MKEIIPGLVLITVALRRLISMKATGAIRCERHCYHRTNPDGSEVTQTTTEVAVNFHVENTPLLPPFEFGDDSN